ncbi:hypothetical protein G6O67_000638 [Ophiocordyceps sinensis]|uniref:Fungal-type protein kinase domain-containing protein n=1 Tax=Ophiocordyceps sinensis TaxID=72228 RepID=A0A8H4PZU7_9HYPO|nr:hypothetical protein G6O67_000638 [Ophiocordyceps sinensis]
MSTAGVPARELGTTPKAHDRARHPRITPRLLEPGFNEGEGEGVCSSNSLPVLALAPAQNRDRGRWSIGCLERARTYRQDQVGAKQVKVDPKVNQLQPADAIIKQMYGTKLSTSDACDQCQKGNGPFTSSISSPEPSYNEATGRSFTTTNDQHSIYKVDSLTPPNLAPVNHPALRHHRQSRYRPPGSYDNRVFRCLVISPAGRAIHKYDRKSELLGALRDAIKTHRAGVREYLRRGGPTEQALGPLIYSSSDIHARMKMIKGKWRQDPPHITVSYQTAQCEAGGKY